MGLYLALFAGADTDDEVDGVEVGSYEDFGALRDAVHRLETGGWGSRFPVLLLHEDGDGEWSPTQCEALVAELATIRAELAALPYELFGDARTWQAERTRLEGLPTSTRLDNFFDVDGEPLVDRISGLARAAVEVGQPIVLC